MNFGFCRTYHLHSVSNVTHNIYCAQSKCEKRSIILAHAHSCLSRSRFVRISAENRRLFLSHNIFDVLFVCFISKLMAWCRLSDRENVFFCSSFTFMHFTSTIIDITVGTIGFSCTPPTHINSIAAIRLHLINAYRYRCSYYKHVFENFMHYSPEYRAFFPSDMCVLCVSDTHKNLLNAIRWNHVDLSEGI